MMYDKLVRDGIPNKIKRDGKTPRTHTADDIEFAAKLRAKLKEEVDEFLVDGNIEELADVLEVVYALSELNDIQKEKLEAIRKRKLISAGGFKDRLILDEVD